MVFVKASRRAGGQLDIADLPTPRTELLLACGPHLAYVVERSERSPDLLAISWSGALASCRVRLATAAQVPYR